MVHGNLLRRILPPGPDPATLPEPRSEGARLLQRYCVQCHHLPSPAMHTAADWPTIVDRMVWRMEGKGNLGPLMKDLMEEVEAPTAAEKKILVAYLKKHGQQAIDPRRYPDLATPEGQAFELACSQCHATPDPRRHTAKEWPAVVDRMRRYLAWHGTIEGGPSSPKNAVELDLEAILAFLKKHSRSN
jgi:cytochrome c5